MRCCDIGSLSAMLAWAFVIVAPVAAAPNRTTTNDQLLLNALRDPYDEPLAATLIDKHADVNARDETGATPLIWAAQHQSLELVVRLLKAGADPNLLSDNALGPLQVAIANHAGDIATLLLDNGAKATVARDDGETALMTAARTGQVDVMKQLIAHGVDLNAQEHVFHQTALMWSAGHPAAVKLLIEHGVNVRARTKTWEVTNAFYVASYSGHPEPWANLGEYVSKKGGQSALHFAVQKDDLESVRALLDAGVDVNDPAADGSTALLLSLYKWGNASGRGEIVEEGRQSGDPPFQPNVQIARLLLDRGARVDVANAEGYSPLHGAVAALVPQGRLARDVRFSDPAFVAAKPAVDPVQGMALVERLLALKSDVNAVTRYPIPGPVGAVRIDRTPPGSSPLHIAALSGNASLVDALLVRGGDPNLVRQDGHSPLSIAVKVNDLAVLKILVAHGADVQRVFNPTEVFPINTRNRCWLENDSRKDQSILHIASMAGAFSVVAFLADQGVPLNAKNDRGETALFLADMREQCQYFADKLKEDKAAPAKVGEQTVRDTKTTDAIKTLLNPRIVSKTPTRSAARGF
jgi:ankyrin repeat protein